MPTEPQHYTVHCIFPLICLMYTVWDTAHHTREQHASFMVSIMVMCGAKLIDTAVFCTWLAAHSYKWLAMLAGSSGHDIVWRRYCWYIALDRYPQAETKRAIVRRAIPYLKPHTYIYVHIANRHAYIDVHAKHTPTRVCVLLVCGVLSPTSCLPWHRLAQRCRKLTLARQTKTIWSYVMLNLWCT